LPEPLEIVHVASRRNSSARTILLIAFRVFCRDPQAASNVRFPGGHGCSSTVRIWCISEIPEGRRGRTGSATLPGIGHGGPGRLGRREFVPNGIWKGMRRSTAVTPGRPKRLFFMGASLQRAAPRRNDMRRLHNHALSAMRTGRSAWPGDA
jgi:hypothetical protein